MDVLSRWHGHERSLRRNKHPNVILQRAWNKHGEFVFVFETIELCPKSKLISREQFWIDTLCSAKLGYNIAPTAGSMLGYSHRPDTKIKIGKSSSGTNSAVYRHGASKHPLCWVWQDMLRHYARKDDRGGPHVEIFEEWKSDVWSFIRWGEANGWVRGLEFDRKKLDGDYTPENCRFVTASDKTRNRRPYKLTPEGKRAVRKSVAASNRRRIWTAEQRKAASDRLMLGFRAMLQRRASRGNAQ